jgi:histidine triad (HIT) family protein
MDPQTGDDATEGAAAIRVTPTAFVPGCLFCRIVAGEIPADVVRESARTLAFRDIAPQAPTHVLVVAKDHHADAAALSAADPGLAAVLLAESVAVAVAEGVAASGYRLVLNTGQQGGQTVDHVHVHVLGGRPMTWPPG